MNGRKKVERLYEQCEKAAEDYIISEARKILKAHKNLDEFVIAMGDWFFTTKQADEQGQHVLFNTPKYINESELFKFLYDWDRSLYLSGMGIRFRVDGPITTNW